MKYSEVSNMSFLLFPCSLFTAFPWRDS